jgi:pyruvate,orthophosphate dikinase
VRIGKFVYLFDEGHAGMRDLLGGKGANLCEMTRMGFPVPPGFVITTEACIHHAAHGAFPPGMREEVLAALRALEEKTGRGFGDPRNPLLVSVRSGSAVSMPGMMDTVLNLGLNEATADGLARLAKDERSAWDAYRRLVAMFGRIVEAIDGRIFDTILERYKAGTEGGTDADLSAEMLRNVVAEFKEAYQHEVGAPFPDDPEEQLFRAIEAVFASWMGKRAVDYRNFHGIPHDLGTAASVQTMVFGNLGLDSGTGVVFTRDPATGEKRLYGEYLPNAQGEDVVAGIRNPLRIEEMRDRMPAIYEQLSALAERLERRYRDMQDVEFTVEKGKLWMLQTRTGKRTAAAAVKVAVDMAREGLISEEEAVLRVEPEQVNQLLLPRFDEAAKEEARRTGRLLARGLNASPGAASGAAIFDPDEAERLGREERKPVILVRIETSPDDVHGMLQARGILTARGGATSHAAVVARGLGKPCVAGCEALRIDYDAGRFEANGTVVQAGDAISIDGATGEVFLGPIETIQPDFEKEVDLRTILDWADRVRRLGVWANADYPRDATRARAFGAEGIGLCRTEHMFFEEDRLPLVRRMILAESVEARRATLDELLPIQREDFVGVFRAMGSLPVVVRLIDPPLHEFLPSYEDLLVEVSTLRAKEEGAETLAEKERLLETVAAMRETNPMLGLRGCRVGILFPEITEMQVRAIFQACCRLKAEGVDVHPEIMIPLVGHVNELRIEREDLERVAEQVMEEEGVTVDYKFGTMIEIPRACLTADEIARYAEFFSFGTNDLTQTVFGYSRDDAEGKFLLEYVTRGVLPANPFQTLDRDGVGELMRLAVAKGRAARPDLKIGICGEHGGDPDSVAFCHAIGLDYVSCSPFRVPVARLAAAHAALGEEDVPAPGA